MAWSIVFNNHCNSQIIREDSKCCKSCRGNVSHPLLHNTEPKGTGETLNSQPDSQPEDQLSGMQEIQSEKNAISVTRSGSVTLSPHSYPSTSFNWIKYKICKLKESISILNLCWISTHYIGKSLILLLFINWVVLHICINSKVLTYNEIIKGIKL